MQKKFWNRLRTTLLSKLLRKVHGEVHSWIENIHYGKKGRRSHIIKPMRIIGKRRIFLGDGVGILNGARIETIKQWQGDSCNGMLSIGDRTSIEQNCHIIASKEVTIGHDCVFSAFVYISDCSHQYVPEQSIMASPLVRQKVKIGNHVFIGIGACIMPGVTIGDNVVIGAKAVVTKDVPEGCMVAGIPAKIIKKWNGKEWI